MKSMIHNIDMMQSFMTRREIHELCNDFNNNSGL